jgi:outer membrane protein TolC
MRGSRIHVLAGMMVLILAVEISGPAMSAEGGAEPEGQIDLQRVLELALNRSYKIALAKDQFESAAKALKSAKRRRLPRLSAQGWFSGDIFEIDRWGSRNLANYLALDWDFYQDGAIMQLIAQSWANLASAALTVRQTALDLIYNSTALFYEALKAACQVEIAEQQVAVEELQLRILRSEYEQGRRTQSELLEAENRGFEMDLSLTRARHALNRAILKLQQLTRDDTITGVARLPREITWALDFPLENAIRAGLECQPNVLIAQANLEMAKQGVKYAKLKRLPSIRFLTGSDFAFAPYANPQDFEFRVGVIVSYPLYDAGEKKSWIENAESARKRSEIQLGEARYQMVQDVTDSYADVSNQLELLRIAERRHEEVQIVFDRAEADFKEGKIGKLEMERIRLQYLQSLQRVDDLRLDALLARAKLLKNVGVSSLDEIRAYSRRGVEEGK